MRRARQAEISTPASKLRASVLEVLKCEGYIRGYADVDHKDGRTELKIELKYYEASR